MTARRPVVVYDDNGGTAAARAWWLLRWAGLDNVRILVGVLLDARAAERHRGEVEPVDPRAGHIPGARSAPTADNLRDGIFRPTGELREKYGDLRGAKVGVYCGSGVTAAHEIAALSIAGIPTALYPGSWSAWSADPTRPVATGEDT
ncbi:sulfurtransferase [Amycolatopsis sp. NPDC003731]